MGRGCCWTLRVAVGCGKLLSLRPAYHHHLPQAYFFPILPLQGRSLAELGVFSI